MRGLIICLLVFGLTYAEEDNVGAETKDPNSKISGANVNFRFYDKNKRGATKITNTDNPSFNHLSTSNTVSSSSSGGFKPSNVPTTSPPPFKYLYNQQYYQANPYLAYVQIPQAAQIAAQYSIQANPVAHFLQTPNQIQYVSAPTVAQVPQIKFQSFSNDFSSSTSATSESSTSSATGSSYAPQTQQTAAISSQIYTPTSASSAGSGTSATVSQVKQIQVPFHQSYQVAQPVFYQQQPLLTYFPQTPTTNFIYHQPNANFLLKQHQLASIYGTDRFGLYSQTPNAQLTYLVPMVVPQQQQDSTSSTSNLKSSDKSVSNVQQSSTNDSFNYGTKA